MTYRDQCGWEADQCQDSDGLHRSTVIGLLLRNCKIDKAVLLGDEIIRLATKISVPSYLFDLGRGDDTNHLDLPTESVFQFQELIGERFALGEGVF